VAGAVLVPLALRHPDPGGREKPRLRTLRTAFRNRRFAGGLTRMALAAILGGVLTVLGPLHLSAAGWGAGAIGLVWIVAASLETVPARFVGRISDRRGFRLPVQVALATGAFVSVVLAWGDRPALYVPLIIVGTMAYT